MRRNEPGRRILTLLEGVPVAVYRQRTTVADEFLLSTVFPWLADIGVTPLLRLARIWSEPIVLLERPVARKPRSAGPLDTTSGSFRTITSRSVIPSLERTSSEVLIPVGNYEG